MTLRRLQQYKKRAYSLLVFVYFGFQEVNIGVESSEAMRQITLNQPCKFISSRINKQKSRQ